MNASDSLLTKRQFNVQLPQELITQIKHAAIDESVTLSELVDTLLRTSLEQRQAGRSEANESSTAA